MIQPEQVWLVVEPVDMRWGIDRLSMHIQALMGESPCAGRCYGFSNKMHTRLKLLIWDGNGVWLCQRRLHQGRFCWPRPGARSCPLSAAQWQWLISGVDWRRLDVPAPAHWQV